MRTKPNFVEASSCSAHVAHQTFGTLKNCSEAAVSTAVIDIRVPYDATAAAAAQRIAQDVFLVVDVSGSMSGVQENLCTVVRLVAASLTEHDRLCVVSFDSSGRVCWPLASVTARVADRFDAAVDAMFTGGGTNIWAGVELAIRQLVTRPAEGRFRSMMVLSDGQTSGPRLHELSGAIQEKLGTHRCIVNSIGFTHACDLDTMQQIPSGGNAGVGLFYYLRDAEDIDSAIGDCLGSTSAIALTDLELRVFPPSSSSAWDGEQQTSATSGQSQTKTQDMTVDDDNNQKKSPMLGFYEGDLNLTNNRTAMIGAMSGGERHAFIVTQAHYANPFDFVDVELSYLPAGTQVRVRKNFKVSMANPINRNGRLTMPESAIQTIPYTAQTAREAEVHCMTHILRERAAKLLLLSLDSSAYSGPSNPTLENGRDVMQELEDLHDNLIEKINLLQQSLMMDAEQPTEAKKKAKDSSKSMDTDDNNTNDDSQDTNHKLITPESANNNISMFDEGVLNALSNDIGSVLSRQFDAVQSRYRVRRDTSRDDRGRTLRAAHEHAHQRSSHCSAGALASGAYTTPAQLHMRMRFLERVSGVENVAEAKAAVPLDEPGLSADAKALREEVDEHLACFVSLDTWRDAHLGLALVVLPRTNRERRRGLLPRVLLTGDVLSADSYNRGVRAMVEGAAAPAQLDREEADGEDDNDGATVVKSSKRGRINAWLPLYINQEHWKHVSRWARAAISIIGSQFNDKFSPEMCLAVCSKLLIQTVVRFTVEKDVSERTLQQFCDVHRVFLQLASDYPAVAALAEERLNNFITDPSFRGRQSTPDLGDLIQYLCVSKKHTWAQLRKVFVMESIRRATFQMGDAKKKLVQIKDDVDGLMQFWADNTSGGRVTTFCVAFLETVARPADKSLDDVKKDIDARWGRLKPETLQLLRSEVKRINENERSVPQIVSELIGQQLSAGAVAEIILWGFDETSADLLKRTARYLPAFPTQEGPRVAEWRERTAAWQAALKTPAPEIDVWSQQNPLKRKRGPVMRNCVSKLRGKLRRRAVAPGQGTQLDVHDEIYRQVCDCQRCLYRKALNKSRAEWIGLNRPRELIGDEGEDDDNSDSALMFIGGLHKLVDEHQLKGLFYDVGGPVAREVVLVHDKLNPVKSKGYAFATFRNEGEMMTKMAMLRLSALDQNLAGDVEPVQQSRDSDIVSSFPVLERIVSQAEMAAQADKDQAVGDDGDARALVTVPTQLRMKNKPLVFDTVRRKQPGFIPKYLR